MVAYPSVMSCDVRIHAIETCCIAAGRAQAPRRCLGAGAWGQWTPARRLEACGAPSPEKCFGKKVALA